ncbi:MAG: hypothetical protein EO766_12450 [Hydrotalea sp. AMD]|uniref:hypothetical protein n=1 Tax=Hydrotalea TaxID=1004300 RepID=UPI000942F6E4|nr:MULTISPECIES: hypothetical protein [Hydrotalea]RWZ86995.1 MAG: hypothetical protein EO766_12450 [Hydrotalea sp. AMD]
MNPRSSHTHCQVAPADPQAKTWQRVCLPHPEKIELKKFPDPSENKKYANAQNNDRQKSVSKQTPKPLTAKRFNYSVDRRPACNMGFAKWRLTCFYDSFVQGSTFGILINISAKNPPLRKAQNRWQ